MKSLFKSISLTIAAACLVAANVVWASEQITVTDSAGRQITIEQPVERIVCLGPGCLRLIVYLQAQDKVVGVEGLEAQYPDSRPYFLANTWLAGLPKIGPGGVPAIGGLPDIEALLNVRPQVIFATYLHPDKAARLEQLSGAKVVLLDYGPFAGIDVDVLLKSLGIAGQVLGKQKRAKEVAAYVNSCLADMKRRTQGVAKPARAYVGGIGFKGSHGIDSTDADYVPFEWLSVINAAKGQGQGAHCFVAHELLLGLDPEVIFVDSGGVVMLEGDFKKRPAYYQSLSAFKNGRVYILHPFNWYTTNLGTALIDAYAIGTILYPQRFADVNLDKKADEVYQHLVGKPLASKMVEIYGPQGQRPDYIKAPEQSK